MSIFNYIIQYKYGITDLFSHVMYSEFQLAPDLFKQLYARHLVSENRMLVAQLVYT